MNESQVERSNAAARAARVAGTGFALAAGAMWGLVFVAPLLLPDYPPSLLSAGRYLAFGLIAVPLAWVDRARLREFGRADWREAVRLSVVGNLLYYFLLAAAIQRAGAPLPTMIIGTLPVVIALVSNRAARRAGSAHGPVLGWRRLGPSLALIAAGLAAVHHAELAHLRAQAGAADAAGYALGIACALGALACWTWYPVRNAAWLRAHPGRSPRAWATAQGLATLPLALLAYLAFWIWTAVAPGAAPLPMPLGRDPARFVALMLALGLFASWLGTLCWNAASQRLPTALAGQLIVFETLAALLYAFALRGGTPDASTLAGVALLVAGVIWALREPPVQAPVRSPDR